MTSFRFLLSTIVAALLIGDTAFAAETSDKPATAAAYPLDYCIISGEKLGEAGAPVVKTYDGREVKFCCNQCVKSFEKDPANWTKKLDKAIVETQQDHYPLETCVVSGEKLGGMGEPTNYVYQNRLVRFCCDGCIKTFEKNPEKYLGMIDAAATKEMPEKPTKDMHQHEGMGH
ncbi:hypothetical protein KKH27_02040 [bacterium]|nr:hypothetical protein [bacterium]